MTFQQRPTTASKPTAAFAANNFCAAQQVAIYSSAKDVFRTPVAGFCLQKLLLSFFLLFAGSASFAQNMFTRGLVYSEPAMKKVRVKEGISFRSVSDTVLSFDIYYPPAFTAKRPLPLVIFNNGVGLMDLHRWRIYRDWAKLVAAHGLIAVTHQSRSGHSLEDGEALIDHLAKNAKTLHIDAERIGIWTCSANARTGMRLAHKSRPENIKALAVYYGPPDSLGQLRQDLPTLLVRAGLDAQFLNTGIDHFVQASLQQDARLELINYVNGMHAFDAYTATDEAKSIILSTVAFLKQKLTTAVPERRFVLTNKNFMWLIQNNQLQTALDEFRKARTTYRADSSFHPFYNAVIREDVLNANAYSLLRIGRRNEALALFQLAVESYPESANAQESLSEGYEANGNREAAIRHAEMALQQLPLSTGINERLKEQIKQSAAERLKRLRDTTVAPQGSRPPGQH